MNVDVFPIGKGGFSWAMLVYRRVNVFHSPKKTWCLLLFCLKLNCNKTRGGVGVVWLLFSEFCLVVSKIFGLLFCPEIWGDDPMLTNSMFQVFQVSGKTNTKLVSPCFLFDVHSVMSSIIFWIFLVHVRTLPTAFSRTWSGAELFQRTPVKSQFTSHLKTNISPWLESMKLLATKEWSHFLRRKNESFIFRGGRGYLEDHPRTWFSG